ncbi:MAG TPA: BamA/TamA family outer membrane protein, partial [Gemmatimonadales bacterium]|nr:BamA/TamA family outer membrane protein [Gemmatimonadales bacterium]
MLLSLAHLTLLFQLGSPSAAVVQSDAPSDSATAALVGRLRAARDRNERLVTSYSAIARQRIGVGIRALSRDRMLYRNELAARISWFRDSPSRVEVVGAREGIPIVNRGDQVPEDIGSEARDLVLNPADDHLRLAIGEDDDGFIYPLRDGSEADYRFEAGDTTRIRLPDGREIRLLALRVTARRAEWRLISGTFWFDAETHGLVRAAFRPARPFEFRRDVSEEDKEDVPSWVNPVGEVKYITMEYGLYEARWWLPRYIAMEATGSMGEWLNVPFVIERIYEDYEVEGGTPPPEGSTFVPAGTIRPRNREDLPEPKVDSVEAARIADSVAAVVQACIEERTRALADRPDRERRRLVRIETRRCSRRASPNANLVVDVPDDADALLNSPELGAPILAMGDMITEEEIRGMRDAIGQLPSAPWQPRLSLPAGVGAVLAQTRYNRIEALSLGAKGKLALGPMEVNGSARLGLADLVPNATLGLARSAPDVRYGLNGYYRLAAANPDTRPFGPVNSVFSFVAQRDDGEYYRALGAEFLAENANAGWWSARAFVQRERPVEVGTDVSIPHLFSSDNRFRPNIVADSADQFGGSLTFRGNRPLSRTIQVGGETTVEGAGGDFEYGKVAGTVRLFVTPDGPIAGAITASAGTSTGDVPVQSRFFLGGAATLRGYHGGILSGSAFWAGRVEVGNRWPAVRISLFSDVGWAGDRSRFSGGSPLISTGVGASFLDGLMRIDLAVGLKDPKGVRLELYFDGIL